MESSGGLSIRYEELIQCCVVVVSQVLFTVGGIVTFTASALAEDLLGCRQLISKIIEHPLWDCYLIPEVVAVSHLMCSDGDLSTPR